MTITWEWQVGAHFGADSIGYEIASADQTGITTSTTQVKTGARSFMLNQAAHNARKAVSASKQKRQGIHVYLTGLPASGTYRLVSFTDSSGNQLIEVRVKADGTLALYVATVEQTDHYPAMSLNAWRHIGLDVKIDGSAGWAKVYLDGAEVIDYAGNSGTADIAYAYFGGGPSALGLSYYFDDWYVEDTTSEGSAAAVPMRQFYPMLISGDGNYSQFDGSDGNKTNNYALCDETGVGGTSPPNEDTDYVYATTDNVIDSYATTDYTIIAGMTVNAVHPWFIAKKTGVAATSCAPFLRENSTDWEGTAQLVASDYALHIERRTTAPDASAWDQSAINGLEVGVQSEGAYA